MTASTSLRSSFLGPSIASAPVIRGLTLLVVLLLASGCGADDTAGHSGDFNLGEEYDNQEQENNQLPTGPAPEIITAIDTIAPATARAGESIDVRCVYLDPVGNPIELDEDEIPYERILVYPDESIVEQGDQLIAKRAGQSAVACQAPQLGLTDLEPAEILIEPGPVHTTTTTLSDNQIVAGQSVDATCEAYDAFGNSIDDASFELVADTSSPGIVIDNQGLNASITTAGVFVFDCHVEGASRRYGDSIEVRPDKPAELFAELIPDQNIYSIGQVITIGTLVQDRFGNTIDDAAIDYDAAPTGESFGLGRFRFHADGTYVVSAEVVDPTHDDVHLYEEIELVVNDTGPSINCVAPFDGEMIHMNPGSNINFEVSVADEHGIGEVRINGETASLDNKDHYSRSVSTRYGINFVDISATDGYGEENVRTCAFLVSANWADEDGFIDDAVSLALFQDAIDDKNYQGPGNIRSLNDLILTVLNSEGLRQEIESGIRAGNPYAVDTCNFDVYVNAVYFDGAPHVTSLDLIGGGMEVFARVNDIYIDLTIRDGNFLCFGPYNPTLILEYVEILATTELLMENNLPILRLDEVIYVESGEVDASGGNWFSDFVYDAATDLFQGTFRDLVEDTFEDAITDNFDDLFEGLMGSLDVETLGGQIDVPRLDGSGELGLNFGFQFSTAHASSARALFGLAPRLTPESAGQGIASLGVPHPGGNMLMDSSGNSASAAVHVALINQALHALWRGGLFHADVGGALGDDIPDGASVQLETRLPPVLAMDSEGSAQLMLGAVELNLQYPGIFDDPVTMMLGLVGSTQISLSQEEISFSDIQLQEFHLSAMDVSLNSGTREVLENFLMGLFQDIVDQSLNEALPALPIPSFEIPASMGAYDLPVGQSLGLFNTYMNQTSRHLELHGQFGIE